MITDAEIAAALDSVEVSNAAAARAAGVGVARVRRVRAELGLPMFRRGRRPAGDSWEDAFAARTLAVEDGHVEWTGRRSATGTPVMHLRGEIRTAYRHAFVVEHGREPVGHVMPCCGYPSCVAGPHLADRQIREQRRAAEAGG